MKYCRVLKHEFEKNPYFRIADYPELARIFYQESKPANELTLPRDVSDKYFQDTLNVGTPLIRATVNANSKTSGTF